MAGDNMYPRHAHFDVGMIKMNSETPMELPRPLSRGLSA